MVTHVLWSALQLDKHFGLPAPLYHLEPEELIEAIRYIRACNTRNLRAELVVRDVALSERRYFSAPVAYECLAAVRLVRFGVRAFEVPSLAHELLKRRNIKDKQPAAVAKGLLAKCDELEAALLDAESEATRRRPRALDDW